MTQVTSTESLFNGSTSAALADGRNQPDANFSPFGSGMKAAGLDAASSASPMEAEERLVATKQETGVDYFYSNCNAGRSTSILAASVASNTNHPFPVFYTSPSGATSVARHCTNDLRRTDEMLSAQSYRLTDQSTLLLDWNIIPVVFRIVR